MSQEEDFAPNFVFLDIDTQVDFISSEGKLYAKGAEEITDILLRLKISAIKQGVPIISTVCAHSEGDPEFENFPPHCIVGTPGQAKIMETLTGDEWVVPNEEGEELPPPGTPHIVVEKQEFSCFTSRYMDQILKNSGMNEAVVYGVVTEVCVKAAALGLRERGWRVCLIDDAIWPINKRAGRKAIAEMEEAGVEVMDSEHILGCLGALGT